MELREKQGHAKPGGESLERLLVTTAQVASMLSISKREVERMVADGRLPQPIRLGKRLVRWNLDTIRRWVDDLESGTSEDGDLR